MDDIAFFDANRQLGRYNRRRSGAPYSLHDLMADMADLSIGESVVYHAMSREYSPSIGNDMLMREVSGRTGLYPCWGLSTWVTGEMPGPSELFSAMKASNVHVVRFFRRFYFVPMSDWSLGPLWCKLEEHRVPLILDYGEPGEGYRELDADEVHRLCSAHPRLPVIYTEHRIRYNRQIYQLLNACPNFHLELSGYWSFRAVEDLTSRFGDQRFLFGTGWPYLDSSAAVAAITYAHVSRHTKAAIASGNMKALLEGVRW